MFVPGPWTLSASGLMHEIDGFDEPAADQHAHRGLFAFESALNLGLGISRSTPAESARSG